MNNHWEFILEIFVISNRKKIFFIDFIEINIKKTDIIS